MTNDFPYKGLEAKPKGSLTSRYTILTNTFKLNAEEQKILKLAIIYWQFKVKYFEANQYGFLFKSNADPRKNRAWKHFANIHDALEREAIDPKTYLYYYFVSCKRMSKPPVYYYAYSECAINKYLGWALKKKKEGFTAVKEVAVTKAGQKQIDLKRYDLLAKKLATQRGISVKQFWEEVYLLQAWKNFSVDYLKQNPYYTRLYKEGAYNGLDLPNPLAKDIK